MSTADCWVLIYLVSMDEASMGDIPALYTSRIDGLLLSAGGEFCIEVAPIFLFFLDLIGRIDHNG